MSYAQHRKIIDADSHVIELDDFLITAAKDEDKNLIPSMSSQNELPVIQEGLDRGRELFRKRQEDPAVMKKFDESILDNTKSGWNRVGAFDPIERSHALDIFGYSLQWILPTFSFHQIAFSLYSCTSTRVDVYECFESSVLAPVFSVSLAFIHGAV